MTKDRLVKRQWRRTPFPAPSEDHRVGVAEPSSRGPEDPPATVQEGLRRRRDLQSLLRPYPGARGLCRGESHAVVNEGYRFRVDLARDEDGIGRGGGLAGLAVEHIGFREEGVEKAGVRDLHPLTRRRSEEHTSELQSQSNL